MDNLQHHIEQSKPKDNFESMLQQNFGKNERSPLILPAPQAIGDQLMREIQQRNKIMRPTPHQSPNVRVRSLFYLKTGLTLLFQNRQLFML